MVTKRDIGTRIFSLERKRFLDLIYILYCYKDVGKCLRFRSIKIIILS